MQIIEVQSQQHKKEFLEVAKIIYKDDKNWVRPLDSDIESVFDADKNNYYKHGEATRWILKDNNNNLLGRIAAFINFNTANDKDKIIGGIGFFECINDEKIAFRLFDIAKDWLQKKGVNTIDGPVNFGEKDKWWGLLINGFKDPTYCMNYNPSYYSSLFEHYGFKPYYEQYNYSISPHLDLPPIFAKLAERVERSNSYHCEHINKNNLQKYAANFRTIYNKAWQKHDNFKEMSAEQALSLIKTIKPIMEEKYIWFTYHNNEPIGFFVMLPELNQIIKHLNGKLNLIGKLKFVWHKYMGTCHKMFGVVFGITPEHQGKGIESYMITCTHKVIRYQTIPRYGTYLDWRF
jgi:hypothetical protein